MIATVGSITGSDGERMPEGARVKVRSAPKAVMDARIGFPNSGRFSAAQVWGERVEGGLSAAKKTQVAEPQH